MIFKKKALILSALVAALALANILTFVFDPGKPRSSSFAWLDPSLLGAADRIEIFGRADADGNRLVFIRKNNRWVFPAEAGGLPGRELPGRELPVKQARVEDLLSALSLKAAYPRRAASSEARSALALEEGRSSRILVRGGAGLPLLDLLIGTADALGREVYFRKAGQSEIYSGEDLFTVYTESKSSSWYDLRLFSSEGGIPGDAVQQAEVKFYNEDEGKTSFMLRRQRGGWFMPGNESSVVDSQRVEAWLRNILEAEAEDFGFDTPDNPERSITLRLGDGSSRIILIGAENESKRWNVSLSNSDLVYMLPEWTMNRLFREQPYFITEQ